MPKSTQKKTKEIKVKSTRITKPKEVEQKTSIWSIFKFGESYTSLILGVIFVVIATVILLTFVKGKNSAVETKGTSQKVVSQSNAVATPEVTKKVLNVEHKNTTVSGSTYTVKKDDTLWSIAEDKYKSGYNWVDIQNANKLTNPGLLYAGTKLVLPNIQPKTATVITTNVEKQNITSSIQTNKISGGSYTIAKGDTLWDIAVRAYGDGYAWTKIARANNLNSPSTIHPGNKLIIPRG